MLIHRNFWGKDFLTSSLSNLWPLVSGVSDQSDMRVCWGLSQLDQQDSRVVQFGLLSTRGLFFILLFCGCCSNIVTLTGSEESTSHMVFASVVSCVLQDRHEDSSTPWRLISNLLHQLVVSHYESSAPVHLRSINALLICSPCSNSLGITLCSVSVFTLTWIIHTQIVC